MVHMILHCLLGCSYQNWLKTKGCPWQFHLITISLMNPRFMFSQHPISCSSHCLHRLILCCCLHVSDCQPWAALMGWEHAPLIDCIAKQHATTHPLHWRILWDRCLILSPIWCPPWHKWMEWIPQSHDFTPPLPHPTSSQSWSICSWADHADDPHCRHPMFAGSSSADSPMPQKVGWLIRVVN